MDALTPVRRLVIHRLVGTALFAPIGGAAVLLHHAIVFIEYAGVSLPVILAFRGVELILFASDIACLVVFIGQETYPFFAEFSGQERVMDKLSGQPMRDVMMTEIRVAVSNYFLQLRLAGRLFGQAFRAVTGRPAASGGHGWWHSA